LYAAASECRVKPDPDQPVRQKARVLPGGHALPSAAPIEQVLARLLATARQVFINRQPGLLGQLESYRPVGLSLAHGRPLDGITVGGNIIDPDGDEVATPQLAVDGKIEQCQIAYLCFRGCRFYTAKTHFGH
jgi:hypothetical protein